MSDVQQAARGLVSIVEMSGIYGRKILEGVASYLRSHRPWTVFLEQRELRAPPPPWLLRTRWDGIICRSTTDGLAQAIRRRKIPTVDLNDMYGGLGLARGSGRTTQAIGRLGAEHLLERGFRNFAFCGFSEETWAAGRRDGFRRSRMPCRPQVRGLRVPLARAARARMG